jgi:hypothetical protein
MHSMYFDKIEEALIHMQRCGLSIEAQAALVERYDALAVKPFVRLAKASRRFDWSLVAIGASACVALIATILQWTLR